MVRSAAADAGFPLVLPGRVGLGCERVADWVSLELCLAPIAQMAPAVLIGMLSLPPAGVYCKI